MNSYVVLDIETTGLSPQTEHIIEIGAVKVINGVIVGEFNELINPQVVISPFITNLTGITNEMVKDADDLHTVLSRFLTFISDVDVLIGHNIDRFDLPFIKAKMDLCQHPMKEYQTIDTVTLAKTCMSRDVVKSFRLDALCDHLGITIEGRHRAFGDVYATYLLFSQHLYDHLDKYKKTSDDEICPTCQTGKMILRKGRYGSFKGCSNYPACKHTQKVS